MKLFNNDWNIASKQIPAKSVDCIVTDPPFGVDFKNDIYEDNKSWVYFQMEKWLLGMYNVLKDNTCCFIYVGVKSLNLWIDAAIKVGFNYKNCLATKIYDSYNYAGGNNFKFNFQPILFLVKGKAKKFNKVDFFFTSESWYNDKRNKNRQRYTYSYSSFIDKDICFSNVKTNKSLKHAHNSEKNIKLIKFFIEISTSQNQTVLDPFMGSGVVGKACKLLKREFIGCELNKNVFEQTKNNLENYKQDN